MVGALWKPLTRSTFSSASTSPFSIATRRASSLGLIEPVSASSTGITPQSNAIFRHTWGLAVMARMGAAGRAELIVAADLPLFEITRTACAFKIFWHIGCGVGDNIPDGVRGVINTPWGTAICTTFPQIELCLSGNSIHHFDRLGVKRASSCFRR